MNIPTLAGGALLAALTALPAVAADMTLKAISFDRHDSTYTKPLLEMVDIVNASGTGLTLEMVPDGTMSPFAVGNAVKTGVADIANLPFTFYQNLLPIGDAMKLATITSAELAANGTVDFLDQLHQAHVNAKMLGIFGDGIKFYAYLRDKKITEPNLAGLKMRITPIYRAAFSAFGADVVQMPPPDVYTALERGVIDGYGWTILDIPNVGWGKFTKYRVEPGFFQAWSNLMINLDTWNKLDAGQQKALVDAAATVGKAFNERVPALVAQGEKQQAELGIEVIRFEGAAGEAFLDKVHEASWEEAKSIDAENAGKLRPMIDK
jgi:TRAP-type C4-dicarboxylate transport system substrate-binding protein